MEKGTSEYANDWTSENNLVIHFGRHGKQMGYKNINDYARGARNAANSKNSISRTKDDGRTYTYNPQTNELVITNGNGKIISYFPPRDGIDYFYGQFD